MKNNNPPRWVDVFLEWYCSKDYIEEVQGDLHEWFNHRVEKQGLGKARLLYFMDVIRFMRSYRLKSTEELSQNSNHIAMFRNYFITSWRSLSKNRAFSVINILGLAVGMSAFILIALYVQHERSYDQFQAKKDNLYRIQQDRYNKGELSTQWAAGCAAIGQELTENFPEVTDYVRMTPSNAVVSYKDKVFREEHALYASKKFFQVFSIPLIEGNDSLVLKEPYTVVLSQSTAKKYFGDEDPVGKTLRHNGNKNFEVTGVFEDVPKKSHMAADMLFSFETYVDLVGEDVYTAWNWDGFYNYIVLAKGTNPADFESKIPAFVDSKIGEEQASSNQMVEFHLQPITDIHLTSNYIMEFKPNGDEQATDFLLIIAIFIILIAWVNYINLATAKSMDRSREVGIRKVMGSQKGQLIKQFLVESFILNFGALILAIGLVFLFMPYFNVLSGRDLTVNFQNSELWLMFSSLLFVGAVLSGLYPAFVLSRFRPVAILKGKFINSAKGNYLRKGLVIFQFIASLVLMVGTLTVFNQLSYMSNQDLGVNIEKTLVLRGPNVTDSLYSNNLNTFKQTLLTHSDISSITASTAVPGESPSWNAGGIRLLEEGESESNQYRVIGADYDFLDAYNLTLLSGRKFDKERADDENTVLLNESGAKLMGFKDLQGPLQRKINFWGDTFNIVGVVKDYHQESLKKSFEPLIFRLIPNARNYYSLKLNTNNMSQSIAGIEAEWKTMFPGNPFDFFFLDDHFDQQYKADEQFGKVFALFATLAIFIACLGLFGLASYMTSQRTKEIGVRKVLGATLMNVVGLLSKDFVLLVLIAIILAIPVSWFIMNDWLASFAYRIGLSWWLFAVPGLALIVIALTTVIYQTLKAATSNPVNALRQE